MNTGDIKRVNGRNCVVLYISDYEVVFQSLDEERYIFNVPRTKTLGLKTGQ